MRFLSIVKMTYAEGFEKGYISGSVNAFAQPDPLGPAW